MVISKTVQEIILTIDMDYSAGSKTMRIFDETNDVHFETWLLYPGTDESQNIKIGPYSIDACPDGKIAHGRFPFVLISHGGGGSHLLYRIVAQYLSQNGYIVAMVEHYGNNRKDNSLEGNNKNLTLRTRHIQLVIDTLLSDHEFKVHIDSQNIFMIGHSMGGCTALAIAGAVPWSVDKVQIEVTHDERVKALVLFAPAAAWYQHPDSFSNVDVPIVVFSAEHDTITPHWQAELIKKNVKNPALVDLRIVKNAGHLSFLAPFPESMRNSNFPPSQDPDGFHREAFHETLKVEVLDIFNKQLQKGL
jgi:predicted dienelactone hydrolase